MPIKQRNHHGDIFKYDFPVYVLTEALQTIVFWETYLADHNNKQELKKVL